VFPKSFKKTALLIAVGLPALTGAACFPAESSRLKTSELYADFRAGHRPDGVGVSAELQVGSGASADVRLSSGDRLVAYAMGQAFPMTEQPCDRCVPGVIPPQGALLPASAATGEIRIALERTQGTSAPQSVTRLPSAHEITFPPAGMFTSASPASRSGLGTITVTWAPTAPEDTVDVNVTGCDSNIPRRLAAGSGQLSFDLRTLTPAAPSVPCDLYFQVVLSRQGTVDPAFGKGGQFLATRERIAMITTAP